MEHPSEVLGTLVGDLDGDMIWVRSERGTEPVLLAWSEAFPSGSEDAADTVEGIARSAPVPEGLLLDPAADVIDCFCADFDGSSTLSVVPRQKGGS